ncbi:MAG: GDSL-type esterase/lipase family protein [Janthinobacterium lividum]
MAAPPAEGREWVASWATSIQGAYIAPVNPLPGYVPPYEANPDLRFALPRGTASGAQNQTMRMIIAPDLWGDTVRIRFSNTYGASPLHIQAATVGLQEKQSLIVQGTLTKLSFGHRPAVEVPVGQTLLSDPVHLAFVNDVTRPLLAGRNLAVSFAIAGSSGPLSVHNEAYRTSYISPPGAGDVTGDTSDTNYPYSTLSTFVVSELDVQADDDTLVVCALGDSITDGTFSTTNGSDRWSDALSIRLHRLLGDHVSVVNAGIGGNTVQGSLNSPPATERLDRDVLSLAGLRIVAWLEGSNDIGGLQATPQAVEAGYVNVVHRLHAHGVGVVGLTLTSARPPGGVVPANSPLLSESAAFAALYASAHYDADRRELNAYIKTSGLFDLVADIATATTDPATGSTYERFVPNSDGSAGDYLHLNRAGYQVIADTIVKMEKLGY